MDYRLLQLVCLMMLSSSTKEQPVDLNHASDSSKLTSEVAEDEKSNNGSTQSEEDVPVPRNSSIERWNHSRTLLKSSTLGYEQWWYLTTQRPLISYKDYPGRPGVASWTELSSGENRKSRKMANSPTSESISSEAFHLKPTFPSPFIYSFLWIFFLSYITLT